MHLTVSTALQHPETHEWEIHTPTVKAQKYWITNVRKTVTEKHGYSK